MFATNAACPKFVHTHCYLRCKNTSSILIAILTHPNSKYSTCVFHHVFHVLQHGFAFSSPCPLLDERSWEYWNLTKNILTSRYCALNLSPELGTCYCCASFHLKTFDISISIYCNSAHLRMGFVQICANSHKLTRCLTYQRLVIQHWWK